MDAKKWEILIGRVTWFIFFITPGLPSDQAWGQNKKQFYHTDVDDGDIYGRSSLSIFFICSPGSLKCTEKNLQ